MRAVIADGECESRAKKAEEDGGSLSLHDDGWIWMDMDGYGWI